MASRSRSASVGTFRLPKRPITTSKKVSWLTQRTLDVAEAARKHLLSVPSSKRGETVRHLIEDGEVVFGVWEEPSDPLGIRVNIIRSSAAYEEFAALVPTDYEKAMEQLVGTAISAIPCVHERQAIKLQKSFGNQPTPTASGPDDLVLKDTGEDLFVIKGGVTIAKRGRPNTLHARTWIPLEPGYAVHDSKDDSEIVVMHRGVRVH